MVRRNCRRTCDGTANDRDLNMSFILDALKKSEAERQRQNTPGIANVPDASARKPSHKWIWIVAILLAINIAALFGVLYLANQEGQPPVVTTPVAPGNNVQSTASFSEIVREAKRSEPERQAAAEAEDPTAAPAAAEASAISESYASFNDLRTQGVLSLPDLHLDIHVYSGQPADRFVFINMTKYRENARLSEGPLVKQITPEGVVLDYQGTDFLLPRE